MMLTYACYICVALVTGVSGQTTCDTCTKGSGDEITRYLQQLQSRVSAIASTLESKTTHGSTDVPAETNKSESDCYTDVTSGEQYRVRIQGHLVPCEPTYGGWLVFVRRVDGSENFYRSWNEYADGFGDWRREFWLGNQRLHEITSQGGYRLRAEMEKWSGMRYWAEYGTFRVASGEFLPADRGRLQDLDLDGEKQNCAVMEKGGWWYDSCFHAHPTGLYRDVTHTKSTEGVKWREARQNWQSFRFMELKLQKVHL